MAQDDLGEVHAPPVVPVMGRAFAAQSHARQGMMLDFLNSLILFSPPNTASNLDPGNRSAPNFPQNGHGSIRLQTLFNDPSDPE